MQTKLLIATLAGIGTVGGGGILAAHMLQGTTIKEQLKEKGFTVIEDDTATWKVVLANYTEAVKTNSELKFENFEGGTDKEAELKKHCVALLSQKSKTRESIKDYKKSVWCIKEQTVSEYLKVEGRITYKTEGNDDNDKWDTKIIAHSKDATTITKIDGLTLSAKDLTVATEPDRQKIKASCQNLNAKKHYEDKFEESKALSTSWCSS